MTFTEAFTKLFKDGGMIYNPNMRFKGYGKQSCAYIIIHNEVAYVGILYRDPQLKDYIEWCTAFEYTISKDDFEFTGWEWFECPADNNGNYPKDVRI